MPQDGISNDSAVKSIDARQLEPIQNSGVIDHLWQRHIRLCTFGHDT
jgi:hypothetical protein